MGCVVEYCQNYTGDIVLHLDNNGYIVRHDLKESGALWAALKHFGEWLSAFIKEQWKENE